MKKALIIIGGIILAIVITIIISFKIVENKLDGLQDIVIDPIDVSDYADGVYVGEYSQFPVAAKVEVTIQAGVITAIDIIEHEHGKGAAAEAIVSDVILSQSLEVDAIAGATHSSLVILLAIADALAGE